MENSTSLYLWINKDLIDVHKSVDNYLSNPTDVSLSILKKDKLFIQAAKSCGTENGKHDLFQVMVTANYIMTEICRRYSAYAYAFPDLSGVAFYRVDKSKLLTLPMKTKLDETGNVTYIKREVEEEL